VIEKFDILNYEPKNFKNYIISLFINADNAVGINTSVKKINRKKFFDRNALNQPRETSARSLLESDVYSNMIILTNRVVALSNLLKKSGIKNQKLNDLIEKEYGRQFDTLNRFLGIENRYVNHDSMRKELRGIILDFDNKVSKILKSSGVPNYKKNFTEMLFQQSLTNGFESIPIVTRSKLISNNGREYVKITEDEPLQAFSKEQKESINNGSYLNSEWYKNLSPFQKDNFEEYKDALVNDKHVLPNKFKFIPGLRNAFKRTDEIYTKDGKKLASNELIHSANPAVVDAGKDSKKLASENIQHLSNITGNKKVFLSGLVTPLGFLSKTPFRSMFREEHKINKHIKEATKNQKNVFYNNIPINIIRSLFGTRSMNGLTTYTRSICRKIGQKYEISLNGITHTKDMIKVIRNFEFFKDKVSPKDKEILEQIKKINLLRTKFSLKNLFSITNTELKLNAEIHVLNDIVNKSNLSNNLKVTPVLFCKSGKDRTEIQTELSQAKVLSNQMEKEGIELGENEILKDSMKSRAAYCVNGYPGGGNAMGNFGVLDKKNIHFYLGDRDNHISPLLSENANSVHFKPKKSKFADKEFDKELWKALNSFKNDLIL
jgi:hypothetical protein